MTFLSQLSRRERLLFFITASLIVVWGSDRFLISPLSNRWRRLNTQILALKTKLSRYVMILSQEKIIEDRYRVYADSFKAKGSKEEVRAAVLQEIETLAKTSGVILTNIIPSTPEEKAFYYRFEIRIELESDISALTRFLYEIQKSQYLLGVTRFNIATKSGTTDILRCSLQLSKIFIP